MNSCGMESYYWINGREEAVLQLDDRFYCFVAEDILIGR